MDARLANFASGDPAAFESLFREYQRQVFAWIVRIVRDRAAAEDLTIETFFRIHRARARFDAEGNFGGWARRIATNLAISHLRRANRTFSLERPAEAGAPSDPDTRHHIAAAFEQLPPKLRAAATLAVIEQQPYSEIADALGISVAAVKSRVFRATRMLRKKLMKMGITP